MQNECNERCIPISEYKEKGCIGHLRFDKRMLIREISLGSTKIGCLDLHSKEYAQCH